MSEIDRALEALGSAASIGSDMPPLEVMPTESIDLNEEILACGGLPRGRAIEIYAQSSVGKSTFAQWLAGQVQKRTWNLEFEDGSKVSRPGTVCWFDAERTLMKEYAEGSGMDMSRVVVPDFGLGSDMLYKLKQAIALDAFDLIVVDSIQAVIPDSVADIKGQRNMRDKLASATMWAQFFQELQGGFKIRTAAGKLIQSKNPEYVYAVEEDDDNSRVRKAPRETLVTNFHRMGSKKCCIIFINHARTKISTGFSRGPKTYTPGGGEKDFAFSCRIEMKLRASKTGKIKGERVLKYREIAFKAIKNKLGVPLRERVFFMGIDGSLMLDESDIVDVELDVEAGAVEEEEDSISELKAKLTQLKKKKEEDDGDDGDEDDEDEE